jgi:hypothetical protein
MQVARQNTWAIFFCVRLLHNLSFRLSELLAASLWEKDLTDESSMRTHGRTHQGCKKHFPLP